MSFDATKYAQSVWIHGSDLPPGQGTILTIKGAREITFDDGTEKPALSFEETSSELALNRTQTQTMIDLFTANAAMWPGQKIQLTPAASQFAGKPTIVLALPSEVATAPGVNYQGVQQVKEETPF